MASPVILAICISAIVLIQILPVSSKGGLSVKLIHRDSQESPFHDPSSTSFSRLRLAAERSHSRAIYFGDAIRNAALSPTATSFHSEIIPNNVEYLMSFHLGTPDKIIIAIADTGSDLIWVQCTPCTECHNQSAPLFDPKASSTYKVIPCNANSCPTQWRKNCKSSSQCPYQYGYASGAIVEGLLSSETIGLYSNDNISDVKQLPRILFGCTHRNNGTFDAKDAGLVGLGGGKLSLIRQLGSIIDSRFSYCLPTSTDTNATSLLNFGTNAIISEPNAVTTPLIPGSPDTFYFLSLEQIIVEGQAFIVGKANQTNSTAPRGNTIIDSGSTLTCIDHDTLKSVNDKVNESVSLPQVRDPNGIFDLCFNVSSQRENAKFPLITFQFHGGASVVLHNLNAFIEVAQDIVCHATIPCDDTTMGFNILGNIAQQNFHVGYDLGAMQLTFAPADCAALWI